MNSKIRIIKRIWNWIKTRCFPVHESYVMIWALGVFIGTILSTNNSRAANFSVEWFITDLLVFFIIGILSLIGSMYAIRYMTVEFFDVSEDKGLMFIDMNSEKHFQNNEDWRLELEELIRQLRAKDFDFLSTVENTEYGYFISINPEYEESETETRFEEWKAMLNRITKSDKVQRLVEIDNGWMIFTEKNSKTKGDKDSC